MADFPTQGITSSHSGGMISTASELVGLHVTAAASTAWPSINLAIFFPLRLAVPKTVYKLAVGCGTGSGNNFDVGIYDVAGNRLVSSGATARTATSEVVVDVTDTYLDAGLYYLAVAADSVSTMTCFALGTASVARLVGAMEAASSYVLPSTVTYAAITGSAVPSASAYLYPA